MTIETLTELWEKHMDEEYLKFDRVQDKRSGRADLHAFILLDKLVPGTSDIISCSEHDEFYPSTDVEELAKVITPEQILELIRCGVRLDAGLPSLAMFA